MDENNNGPVPGIIGQDTPSEAAPAPVANEPEKDNGKIFDSSKFTGEEPESLVLNKNGETTQGEKKAKGQNPFTKWQLWAIFSGVILVGALVAIFVIISIYDGKIKNTEAVAHYDAATNKLENAKDNFENIFKKMSYDAYDIYNEPYSFSLYPTDEEYKTAKKDCLGKYSISADDMSYIESLKTGNDLLASGANVVEAKDRLERIVAGYESATSAIDSCREGVLAPIVKKLDITLGDIEISDAGSGYSNLSQPITIKYNGSTPISSLTIKYSYIDRNGVEMLERYANFDLSGSDQLEKGDVAEGNLFVSRYSQYNVKNDEAAKIKNYKLTIKHISGSYGK